MTAGAKLFGRQCRVTVTPTVGRVSIMETFDVAFEVEKTRLQEPNKAKITIFGLPDDLRARFQNEKGTVTLEAGYKRTMAQLFKGEIRVSASRIGNAQGIGADWETVIEAREGLKSYRTSKVAKSFGAGTPLKVVVKAICDSFENVKVSPQATKMIASIADSFPAGVTVDGTSAKILNDVLRSVGMEWSIQNGQIQILEFDKATNEPAVILNYASGLVGVPEPAETHDDKKFLKVTSLLQPDLLPGRRITVQSPLITGDYICQKVVQKGSLFDNEYYSHIEAQVAA